MANNNWTGLGSGALQGAGTGAALGSFFGPLGTGIGAIGGGLIGAFSGWNAGVDANNAEDEANRKKQEVDNTLNDIIADIQNRKNPYSIDDAGFQRGLDMQRGLMSVNFGGQRGNLEGNMAARGLLGSGQEVGAKTGLAAAQAGAMSNFTNQAVQHQQDRFNAFEGQRQSDLQGAKQGKIGQLNNDLANLANQQSTYNQQLATNAQASIGLLANKDVQAGLKEGAPIIGGMMNQAGGAIQNGIGQVGNFTNGLLAPRPAAPAPQPVAAFNPAGITRTPINRNPRGLAF